MSSERFDQHGHLHWAHREDGSFTDLKKLVDEDHRLVMQMCCICFEYIPVDELWVDEDGTKWDVCLDCHERVRL